MNRIQKIEILTSLVSNISNRVNLWIDDAITKNLLLDYNRNWCSFMIIAKDMLKDKRLPADVRENIESAVATLRPIAGSDLTNINDLEDEMAFKRQQREVMIEIHKAHSAVYDAWHTIWDATPQNTRIASIL